MLKRNIVVPSAQSPKQGVRHRRLSPELLACGVACALALSACGSSDSSPSAGNGGSPPPTSGEPGSPPAQGTSNVTLSWQSPTERADGTALTDLAGFRIYYGTDREDLGNVIDLDNPGLSRYVVENLEVGTTWYFSMTAYDSEGLQSSPSPTVEARLN